MRKIIFIIITVSIAVILAYIVIFGETLGSFQIMSYKQMGDKSNSVNALIEKYNNKNTKELETKEKELVTQIAEHDKQKQDYQDILAKKQTDLANIDAANCYEVDFLWTKVGNFATEYGLDLEFNVTKNVSDQNKNEYVLTDLNFIVTGNYEDIANFTNELENDPRLEFEIRDFNMSRKKVKITIDGKESEQEVLIATFKVYSIAINRVTLIQLTNEQQNALINNNQNISNTTNTTNTNTVSNTNTTNTNTATNSSF